MICNVIFDGENKFDVENEKKSSRVQKKIEVEIAR